jgi:putative membrane protein
VIRYLIGVPLLALIVLFALSNTQVVRLGLWPFDFQLELPLSLAVLTGMGFAFLAGGLVVWIGGLGQRHRAREAEHKARLLEAQLAQARGGGRGG